MTDWGMVLNGIMASATSVTVTAVFAAVLAAVGYLAGWVVERVFYRVFTSMQYEKVLRKYNVEKAFLGIHIRVLIGALLKWWVFLGFFTQAVSLFGLNYIAGMAAAFYALYVNIAVGIVYLAIASVIAMYVGGRLRAMEIPGRELTVKGVQAIIMYFALITALPYFGVTNTYILTKAIEIFLWALAAAFGIGLGLAIGLGAQDTVKDIVKKKREVIEEMFVGKGKK